MTLIMCWMTLLSLDASTLARYTFEETKSGWIAVGKSAALRIAHDTADVKNGSGALAFDYTVGEGIAAAALPLAGVDTQKIESIKFWMKTDVPAALAVLINEKKPGGGYSAVCWSTGNTWQRVELTPADFHLNEGPNDAPDPDGKLDLDAIENIALLDASSFLGAKVDLNAPYVAESHAGKHTFFVDDFELWSGDTRAPKSAAVLDDFSTPQLQWLTLGGAALQPERSGLRATYQQMGERFIVLLRQMGRLDMLSSAALAFEIASEQPAVLVMTFEVHAPGKSEGPRYSAQVEVPGGGKVNHREVLLSAFEAGPDTSEPLKLDQIKTFSILDITGQGTNDSRKNSLWIGDIRGVAETVGK